MDVNNCYVLCTMYTSQLLFPSMQSMHDVDEEMAFTIFMDMCLYIYIHMDISHDMILWFSLVFYDSECVQIVQKYEVGPPQFSCPGLAGITSI